MSPRQKGTKVKGDFKLVHRYEDRWEVWERCSGLIWFNRISLLVGVAILAFVTIKFFGFWSILGTLCGLAFAELIRSQMIYSSLLESACSESPWQEDVYSGYIYREWESTQEKALERALIRRERIQREEERRRQRREYYL